MRRSPADAIAELAWGLIPFARIRSHLYSLSGSLGTAGMSVEAEQTGQQERRARVSLIAGAVLCLVASGGLLWWRYGGAVFNDLVLTTLAWCF